jgi:DNA-binding CsgD family transcriptional regulator
MFLQNGSPLLADDGLILMDLSLTPLAFDQGALTIFQYPHHDDCKPCANYSLPEEIRGVIGDHSPSALSSLNTRVRVGLREYSCRSYLVEADSTGFITHPIVALRLQRAHSVSETLDRVAANYHLTEREHETLRGVANGLTSKEMAFRMNISANTVKVFLRYIMIKVGVSTRTELAAKILTESEDMSRGYN